MDNEIVQRLEAYAKGAEEQGVQDVADGLRSAVAEIERLTAEREATIREFRKVEAERDDARRLVCRHTKKVYHTLKRTAELRGWDCFKEDSK